MKILLLFGGLEHSFLEVYNCIAPFTSDGQLHQFGEEKPIS
jgi:hypothetical protein